MTLSVGLDVLGLLLAFAAAIAYVVGLHWRVRRLEEQQRDLNRRLDDYGGPITPIRRRRSPATRDADDDRAPG